MDNTTLGILAWAWNLVAVGYAVVLDMEDNLDLLSLGIFERYGGVLGLLFIFAHLQPLGKVAEVSFETQT